jgi:hypothetical protein
MWGATRPEALDNCGAYTYDEQRDKSELGGVQCTSVCVVFSVLQKFAQSLVITLGQCAASVLQLWLDCFRVCGVCVCVCAALYKRVHRVRAGGCGSRLVARGVVLYLLGLGARCVGVLLCVACGHWAGVRSRMASVYYLLCIYVAALCWATVSPTEPAAFWLCRRFIILVWAPMAPPPHHTAFLLLILKNFYCCFFAFMIFYYYIAACCLAVRRGCHAWVGICRNVEAGSHIC